MAGGGRRLRVAPALIVLALACASQANADQAADPASAQASDQGMPQAFIEAQRAELAGDYARAERLYGEVIERQPTHTPSLMGRARMRSWLKRFDDAVVDYRTVVANDPGNVEARSGLGWTLGWARQYDQARKVFDYLLTTEPYYLDAQKGMAYIELWSGNADGARKWFEALSSEDPRNHDYKLAIAQAAYLQGDLGASRAAYRDAIELKPDFEAARSGLRAIESAMVERRPQLTVLAGRSEASGIERTGIRLAQLGLQVNRELRLWASHDRGVGFDGFAVDRRVQDAATTTLGAFWNYTPRAATRFEAGIRDLLDEETPVVSVEQVFFLPGGTTPKIGFWWADADQGNEWVANVGVHRWLAPRFAIEPTLYVGNSGEAREYRGALLATFRLAPRAQVGLGFAAGKKDQPNGDADVDRVFGNIEIGLGSRVKFLVYGWRESTEGFDPQTVIAAGLAAYL